MLKQVPPAGIPKPAGSVRDTSEGEAMNAADRLLIRAELRELAPWDYVLVMAYWSWLSVMSMLRRALKRTRA